MVTGSDRNIGWNIPSYDLFCSYENHDGTSNSVKLYIVWTISGVGAIGKRLQKVKRSKNRQGSNREKIPFSHLELVTRSNKFG